MRTGESGIFQGNSVHAEAGDDEHFFVDGVGVVDGDAVFAGGDGGDGQQVGAGAVFFPAEGDVFVLVVGDFAGEFVLFCHDGFAGFVAGKGEDADDGHGVGVVVHGGDD